MSASEDSGQLGPGRPEGQLAPGLDALGQDGLVGDPAQACASADRRRDPRERLAEAEAERGPDRVEHAAVPVERESHEQGCEISARR